LIFFIPVFPFFNSSGRFITNCGISKSNYFFFFLSHRLIKKWLKHCWAVYGTHQFETILYAPSHPLELNIFLPPATCSYLLLTLPFCPFASILLF
jgi:hypothetical protein